MPLAELKDIEKEAKFSFVEITFLVNAERSIKCWEIVVAILQN